MACRMKHRIDVYSPQATPDGIGGYKTEWTFIQTIRGDVTFSSIREEGTGETLVPAGRATATIRRIAGVFVGDVMVIGDAEYKVIGIEPSTLAAMYVKAFLRRNEHGVIENGE